MAKPGGMKSAFGVFNRLYASESVCVMGPVLLTPASLSLRKIISCMPGENLGLPNIGYRGVLGEDSDALESSPAQTLVVLPING